MAEISYIKNKDKTNIAKKNIDKRNRTRIGVRSGLVGIFCNVVLFIIKMIAGILGGHISIMADAFNNLTDMASSVVTLLGFKMAEKPADKQHPYGHGRYEYIAGLVVSIVIMLVGASLFRTSVEKIINPELVIFTITALIILIISILIKLWMWGYNYRLGKRIGSETLIATANDSRNDVIATSAVLVSMIVEAVSGVKIDGFTGAGVAVFIIVSGILSCRDTVSPLIGAMPSQTFTDDIRRTVLAQENIIGVHDIMIHDYGPGRRYISLHAEVPASLGILSAHDVIHKVERKLRECTEADVTIHMDPVEVGDEETLRLKALVSKILYTMDKALRLHDFRIISRKPNECVSFDVAVPADFKGETKELADRIKKSIKMWEPDVDAEIRVDRLFVNY